MAGVHSHSVRAHGYRDPGLKRLEERLKCRPFTWNQLGSPVPDSVLKLRFCFDRRDLPFTKTAHLSNPWNEHKPVKIGRDGQVSFLLYFLCLFLSFGKCSLKLLTLFRRFNRMWVLSSVPFSHWTRTWMSTRWRAVFITNVGRRLNHGLAADRHSASREG